VVTVVMMVMTVVVLKVIDQATKEAQWPPPKSSN